MFGFPFDPMPPFSYMVGLRAGDEIAFIMEGAIFALLVMWSAALMLAVMYFANMPQPRPHWKRER